jgi:SsrA-binding protein
MMAENAKILASNKTAARNYFFLEKFEAGIELFGTEVKSIRQGKVNLKDCYAAVDSGELFVYGMHISPYEKGNIFNKDPLRPKKLLLHKSEIMKLLGAVQRDGCSIIPISMYLKHGRVKVEIALAKGKKLYDKRDDEARRQANRDIERTLRGKFN